MEHVSRFDDFGKVGWIGLVVLGFWLAWPIGLAVLLFLVWSGRARAWRQEARGRWHNMEAQTGGACSWGPWGRGNGGGSATYRPAPSGNKAFDQYREETIRRLEDEQKEFLEYLERLRQARDKAEFDQFMADRRNRTGSSGVPEVQ